MSARIDEVRIALAKLGWMTDPDSVSFLGEGEYHENWRFVFSVSGGPARDAVFRVNHGSQLDLKDQIAYEFLVLGAVEPSGRTPVPLALAADHRGLGSGALAMSFIHGSPFDYRNDSLPAARTLARIHSCAVISHSIIRQAAPLSDVAAECRWLLGRTKEFPCGARRRLQNMADELDRLQSLTGAPGNGSLTVCNTEVNSGNWIMAGNEGYLVDWEKAVVSDPVQDLAHFLSPTTTFWKTDFRFTQSVREDFVAEYRKARNGDATWSLDELLTRTNLMEKAVRLRAISWCLMASEEYKSTSKVIFNEDTRRKLQWYRDSWEELLLE